MRQRILRPAKADIIAISRWYDREQPGVGALFGARIEQTLRLIDEQPQLYQLYFLNTRRVPLYPFPYSLYYRVLGDRIQVVLVAHDHQNPNRLTDRISSRHG
jgi:toxin ParE1/3/4